MSGGLFHPAPRRRRVFAFSLESLGVLAFLLATWTGVALSVGFSLPAAAQGEDLLDLAKFLGLLGANAAVLLASLLVPGLYLAWAAGRGGSFACRLLGIELVNAEGQAPGFVMGLARTLLHGLFWSFTGGLHLVAHLFTATKDGLPDLLLGLRVVVRL